MSAAYFKWSAFVSVGGSFLITGYLTASTWLIVTSVLIFAAMAVDRRDELRGQR